MPLTALNDRRCYPRESLYLPLQISNCMQQNWESGFVLDASPAGLKLCVPESLSVSLDKHVDLRLSFSEDHYYEIGAGTICRIEHCEGDMVLGIRLQEENPLFSRVNMMAFSQKIGEIKAILPEIAQSGLNVLIRGETGTGKNVLAKQIHHERCGVERPFIRVNCPSIPSSLFESELFGHEKGAFTDAKSSAPGYFRLAAGGTILLDEISEIEPHLQAKLLSVIEDKQFTPVGGQKVIPVSANIIATTNVNIEKEIEKGRFRRDLYYRLCELPVYLPALRERSEDVVLLAYKFLLFYCAKFDRAFRKLSPIEIETLRNHTWPGNIRELENYMKQTALLGSFVGPTGGATTQQQSKAVDWNQMDLLADLPADNYTLTELTKLITTRFECMMIEKELAACGQNKTNAAHRLGISYRNFLRKLDQYEPHLT
ncbi:sigma 54-interacting transcriptional regulator [Malonomonas rubra]|uniref:sigma 54-interacting transcriptional regulator n=1 Tax=Malonomonas rubra TaxID=57040 RepID=UPI0026ECAE87|nr:sigma-54 dependent transcriptional regulator [Malonomonas rubra]